MSMRPWAKRLLALRMRWLLLAIYLLMLPVALILHAAREVWKTGPDIRRDLREIFTADATLALPAQGEGENG